MSGYPILYSFRRCPYAMRARLALRSSGQIVALREVKLQAKPQAFLDKSPSGTVPCLVTEDGVIDESLDIMIWALGRNDPQGWMDMTGEGDALIAQCDGPFKRHLDRAKYATRYPEDDPQAHRDAAYDIMSQWDARLSGGYLLGDRMALADAAILPFVRQFAFIDKSAFDAQPWAYVHGWLERFLHSDDFAQIMPKFTPWQPQDVPILFGKGCSDG